MPQDQTDFSAPLAGGPPPTLTADEQRRFKLIAASGLFDPTWYRSQLAEEPEGGELAHYVRYGHAAGRSPHPAFDAEWYAQQPGTPRRFDSEPLLHYLTRGAARGTSPHPLFDAAAYLEAYDDSGRHPGGPVGHYLFSGAWARDQQSANPLHRARAASWPAPDVFLRRARHGAEVVRAARFTEVHPRERDDFDTDAEARLKDRLRNEVVLPDPPPLVSVVLPTFRRPEALRTAVASVFAQTYPHWELIIVDDGGDDDSADAISEAREDSRVQYLRHDVNRGVAAARNTALEAARGTYVAYLDSDNTWFHDFLEIMVLAMTESSSRVAYAMSALVEEGGKGRRLYRGAPFSREALEHRNAIDCIVLVHRRDLLEETGTFDERLRRTVDWDLFIRFARATDFTFVPVLATQYDVWETRTERITTDELASYRYRVLERTLVDWDRVRDDLAHRVPGLLSVVVAATRDGAAARRTAQSVVDAADGPIDVVVVDSHVRASDAVGLHGAFLESPQVRTTRLRQPLPMEVARNVGAAMARGEYLAFVPEDSWCEPGWSASLMTALADAVVAQPVVLNRAGTVWSAGAAFVSDTEILREYIGFPGDAPEVRPTREVPAVTPAAVAVRAVDFAQVRGFDPLYVDDHIGPDVSVRLTSATGRPAVCVGSSVVAGLGPPVTTVGRGSNKSELTNAVVLARHGGELRSQTSGGDGSPEGFAVAGYTRLDDAPGALAPVLVHDRPDRPLRWSIKIGSPSVERRSNWGDWHYAVALRESLERLGHEVTVDCKNAWYRPTAHLDDVVLVLRGVSTYRTNPGHTNVSWVISHPDRVTTAEINGYDLVFGASERWCQADRPGQRQAPELLLQCTDQRRFYPGTPDHARSHAVLAVANARGVRPAVAAALAAGLTPSVYGLRWEGLLPEGAWQGAYLPNDQLRGVYAAAGVVLNDHWADMRQEGLLSNRLFDLAATEARVISDHLPEIPRVFGDVVLTYRTPEQLLSHVHTHLEDSAERRERREALGRLVRSEHTFDARARTLVERVTQVRAAASSRPK